MKKVFCILMVIMILTSVAVCAETTDRVRFSYDYPGYTDISEPVCITVYAQNMEYCEVFVGDMLAATEDGKETEEYGLEMDLSNIGFLGKTVMRVVAYFDGARIVSESAEMEIVLVKLSETEEYLNETFTGMKKSEVAAGAFDARLQGVAGLTPYERGTGDTACQLTMSKKVISSSPFLLKDGLKIADGSIITLEWDVYFSTENEFLSLELRDYAGGYPKNGASNMPGISIFNSGSKLDGSGNSYQKETWYTVRIELNTLSGGLSYYIKGGEYEEFEIQNSLPEFQSVGLNQIRLTFFTNSESGGYVLCDNVKLVTRKNENPWYFTTSYFGGDGAQKAAAEVPVTGNIRLNFSEAVKGISKDSVMLKNESADVIDISVSYDNEAHVATVVPINSLLYGMKYNISVEESVASEADSVRLIGGAIEFTTEKSPVGVASFTKDAQQVDVTIRGYEQLDSGCCIVVVCYDESRMTDINIQRAEQDVECYTAKIENAEEKNVKVFLIEDDKPLDIAK